MIRLSRIKERLIRMSKMSKVSMTNGELYMIQLTPKEITTAFSKSDSDFQEFQLKSGETIYLHAAHIVSIESTGETTSLTDSFDTDHVEVENSHPTQKDKDEKADQNLKAAQAFKKDLEGNME